MRIKSSFTNKITVDEDLVNELKDVESIDEESFNKLLKNRKNTVPNPIISVIVPVYQEEKILDDTLKVFTEELKHKYHFELIVSDGGSTDKTVAIAEKYADYVVKHTKPERQTIAGGRNKGAEIAKGEALIFINGDTVPKDAEIFFQFIYDWINDLNEYKDCPALACTVTIAPEIMRPIDKAFYAVHNNYVRLLNLIGMGMGRGECQMVKKEAFLKVGGYNEVISAGEDFDLYTRLAKVGRIKFVKRIVVYESPRRFRKYGYFRIILSWLANSITVMILGKSVSKEWEAVR